MPPAMLHDHPIPAPLPGLAERLQGVIDAKTKPQGALGGLERLAVALGVAQGGEPVADPACLLLFAADHGIVAEGVSAWPQTVTAEMVRTFLAGGAASTVFARCFGAEVRVIDAGIATPFEAPGLVRAGIRAGTRNAALEEALTPAEVAAALAFGADQGARAAGTSRVVLLGEMGIGNTATAALVAHALTGVPLAALVGPGAGLDAAGVAHKRAVLERAAARAALAPDAAPERVLAAFGGLEIAAMAGALIGAASRGAAVVIDGFIATAAATAALAARPEARRACLFAHRGAEPGHAILLDRLEAEPPLSLGLRLGEGTGALLALPLMRAAAAMVAEMASFEQAAVSGPAAAPVAAPEATR